MPEAKLKQLSAGKQLRLDALMSKNNCVKLNQAAEAWLENGRRHEVLDQVIEQRSKMNRSWLSS